LSGGQRARVSLAVALLGEPPLLILDEPTVGLDPVLRERLWDLFAELAKEGRTLLVSSHVMDEAERCPDLLLLRDGRMLHHGTKQQLLQTTQRSNVHGAFLQLAGGVS
jgi:ABC-2 type transport system ATP-binding protein